jgi:hypothetical protein
VPRGTASGSSAVEVEEGEHACRESLNGVGADECRLPFRGRGKRGPRVEGLGGRGEASASVRRGLEDVSV